MEQTSTILLELQGEKIMATKKKAKKKQPKLKLYREVTTEYTVTGEGLKTLLGWPEGFKIDEITVNCRKKFVDIHGTRSTTTREKNKTTIVSESLTRRVTDAEARKILGLSKSERVDGVEHDYDLLRVHTLDSYEGAYKA